ncbi:uncharacterized protein PGTG_11382 [Puccinia graminis f. sp. tritici CRL 75-36-700-3]|uniref:Uncharacterized protein n=1 Tax=Puccinia graminis f. sp. tritici (strain CRL 75-36-700-3 / race SCCL) TaxID=418459 RepID=E3KM65_PUCGT|nr:uncharacterized protein PGTG_11382 [Puccinia graminis f. sp. tritici CRL 75-36-700-3]EFP85213.2 hypothetical protein PGTG_11382 [Puccinia graminis f. sp. tritici CRL 75-36-700-3]
MAQQINPPVPSTPPNSSNNPVDHPQSVCRESTCLRTPSLRPGFISTQGDSHRALVPSSPAISTNWSQVQAQKKKKNFVNIVEDDEESDSNTNFPPNSRLKSPTNLLAGTKQVASHTGIEVIINHAQDLDLENEKHTNTRKRNDPTKDKDSFDHAWLFFYLPGSGPKQQSLPWLRVEDFLLWVSFDYSLHNAELYSWVWAALHAHQLYLEQRGQVLHSIESSKSKISLVSNVWTTKGSHKDFVGMACCYITPDWKYVCQHLAMKYISWHHNGNYLAVPFANVQQTPGVTISPWPKVFPQFSVRLTKHIGMFSGLTIDVTIVEVMDEDLEEEDVVVMADDISETEEIDSDDAQPGTQEPGW